MKAYFVAMTILLSSPALGLAQTANGLCGDVVNDASATCPSVLDPHSGGSVNSGRSSGSSIGGSGSKVGTPGSAIDDDATNALATPKGMAPLDVPNDPLNGSNKAPTGSGNATGNANPAVPYSNQGVSSGNSGISSPSIK